jgi:heat shock protein HslJ
MKMFKSGVLSAAMVSLLAGGALAAEHKGLDGTNWQLLGLGSVGAVEGAQPTLSFSADGKVSGSGGCNNYTGTVTTSGMAIKFTGLAATKKSCSDELNKQEATFLKALEKATTYENRATSLLINTTEMPEPLSFVPAKM